jgi:MoaE-MoaD fusion protein
VPFPAHSISRRLTPTLPMQVRVLFFGLLKDLAGRGFELITMPDEATVGDVLEYYAKQFASIRGGLSSIAISVNQEYAKREVKLHAGDEVALLPPVSGGADSADDTSRVDDASPGVFIVREKIDTPSLISVLKRPEDGAIVVFEGVARNNTRGRRTLFLDYEAYEPMARKELGALAQQARSQFAIRDLVIAHRLGRLEIGEISVAIVIASAHRAAAFDACRWLIDTLKRTVPIWKKEHFEDGAVWADGEPIPGEDRGARIPEPAHPSE